MWRRNRKAGYVKALRKKVSEAGNFVISAVIVRGVRADSDDSIEGWKWARELHSIAAL